MENNATIASTYEVDSYFLSILLMTLISLLGLCILCGIYLRVKVHNDSLQRRVVIEEEQVHTQGTEMSDDTASE
jgi:uncharacterized membrane protein YciS (DUF1049 family)